MERKIIDRGEKVILYSEGSSSVPHIFRIEECIGQGAGCVAYRAADENGIPVKLKHFCPRKLKRDKPSYAAAEKRFLEAYSNQIQMMSSESSGNVTSGLFGLYRDSDGAPWTAVQSMAGRTLEKVLPELSLNGIIRVLRDIGASISAYHSDGWVLMDLKPENILVIDSPGIRGVNFFDFDSFIKQEDVASAIAGGEVPALSTTPDYSAPELLEVPVNLESITPCCDTYSLGAIAYYSIFGRVPDADCGIPGASFDFSGIPERLRGELSDSASPLLERFLRLTLALSPEGRFDDDGEVLRSLDRLISETDSAEPRLRHVLPESTPKFSGRVSEIKQLSGLLAKKVSPVYICGAAGMGKTELVLKTAELNPGTDFYLASYHGSLKETIASLPCENIPEGSTDERCSAVMDMLRSDYSSETVIIIDSFDISPEEAEALETDPVFLELQSLDVRFMFTSRHSFSGDNVISVERMGNSELKQMMRKSTDVPDSELDRIVSLTDGHTMTLDLISRCISSGSSALSSGQIINSLSKTNRNIPEKDAFDEYRKAFLRLDGIFRASRFSAAESQVLGFSSLFPEHGISSVCLRSALSDSELKSAEKLAAGGWIRCNAGSGFWSVHPLIREIICSEKATAPSKKRVEKFISALKEAEKRDEASLSLQVSELNSLYGAYVRLKDGRKAAPVIAAGAVVCLAAVLGLFFLKRNEASPLPEEPEADPGPMVTVTMKASEGSAEDIAHDSEIIVQRLSLLTGGAEVEVGEDGSISSVFPVSVLGSGNSPVDIIKACVSRPLSLSIVYVKDNKDYVNFPVARDDVVSAEVGGSDGPLDIRSFNSELSSELPYLVLKLKPEAADRLSELISEGVGPVLAHDYNLAEAGIVQNFYYHIYIYPLDDGLSFAVFDPSWTEKRMFDSLCYSYTAEETLLMWEVETVLDRDVIWLSPENFPYAGEYQAEESIFSADETVTLVYSSSAESSSISDSSFEKILAAFCKRLDILGQPYCIGYGTIDSRKVYVKTGGEHINTISANLLSEYPDVKSYYYIDSFLPYERGHASLEPSGDSGNAIVLSWTNESDITALRNFSESLIQSGQDKIFIYLNCSCNGQFSTPFLFSADVTSVIEDGRLVFDGFFYRGTEITEENTYIAKLCVEMLNSEFFDNSIYYHFESYDCPEGVSDFYLNARYPSDSTAGKVLSELIEGDSAYADAAGYDSMGNLNIFLNLEPEGDYFEKAADFIEAFYSGIDADNLYYNDIRFILCPDNVGNFGVLFWNWSTLYGLPQLTVEPFDFDGTHHEQLDEAFAGREFFIEHGYIPFTQNNDSAG